MIYHNFLSVLEKKSGQRKRPLHTFLNAYEFLIPLNHLPILSSLANLGEAQRPQRGRDPL